MDNRLLVQRCASKLGIGLAAAENGGLTQVKFTEQEFRFAPGKCKCLTGGTGDDGLSGEVHRTFKPHAVDHGDECAAVECLNLNLPPEQLGGFICGIGGGNQDEIRTAQCLRADALGIMAVKANDDPDPPEWCVEDLKALI